MCETLARYVARLRALGHQVEPQGEAFLVRSASQSDVAAETVPTALLGFYVRVAEIEAMAISAHAAVAGTSVRPID